MDMGFKFLIFSRIFRSIGIIYVTLVAPLYLKFIGFSLVSIGIIFLFIILFNTILVFVLGLLGDRLQKDTYNRGFISFSSSIFTFF